MNYEDLINQQEKYTFHVVETLLKHWEDVESFKENVTSKLSPNEFNPPSTTWGMKEGNTLMSQLPKTTRVSHNTNKLSETLSCWTSDIEQAIARMLTPEEYDIMMEMSSLPETLVTSEMKEIGSLSIDKLLMYLNR
jgi:hypothetical protein